MPHARLKAVKGSMANSNGPVVLYIGIVAPLRTQVVRLKGCHEQRALTEIVAAKRLEYSCRLTKARRWLADYALQSYSYHNHDSVRLGIATSIAVI